MLMKAIAALTRTFELPEPAAPRRARVEQRYRGLRIGNLSLLVAHDCGGEIIEDARIFPLPRAAIFPLPRAAAWCRGLINLRGNLIPAFDLHESLGLTRLRAARQWWLALGTRDDALAFPVDALPVALLAKEPAVVQSSVIPDQLRAYVSVGFRIDGELWLEFRHRDFFRALPSMALC
jgi:twitching motility protein PilI